MIEITPVFRQVAVILSPALGDSLLLTTVAYNLHRNGVRVTVFGQQGHLLRDWLPALQMRPALDPRAPDLTEVLAAFDAVLQLHDDKPFADLARHHPRVILLEHVCRSAAPYAMVDRLVEFCRDELKLSHVGRANGLTPPSGLQHRRHRMRVAIHPTASTADKCWLASRFLRLGLMLRDSGFDPQFVVAREERAAWASVETAGMMMPDLGSVDKLAGWLYESGWFIGNDSGIGHLASNLQIPTLSLFMRRGIARTWRPGWGTGDVLVGGAFLPGGHLKERYWKYMLSAGRVMRAFDRLRTDALAMNDATPAANPRAESAPRAFPPTLPASSSSRATPSPRATLGRVAFVMSHALGDSLISMVIVDNLLRNGVDVEVFGSTANVLRDWFPQMCIAPLPCAAALPARLAAFDTVIQMQHDQPVADLVTLHPRVLTLHDVEFGARSGCMAERFADFCRNELGLAGVDLDNGIRAPAGLQHRRHAQRIVIHPEASTDDKRWSPHRFIQLAHRLRARGFEVYFVIAPHERERWRDLDAHRISAPHFADLHRLACWVYESGWFIGNDSGVGHLASNLGIPTISLFRRRGVAQRWRPAWGETRVVLSWQWVPTARLKEIFWRETLTCSRVLSVFLALVRREAGHASHEAPVISDISLLHASRSDW